MKRERKALSGVEPTAAACPLSRLLLLLLLELPLLLLLLPMLPVLLALLILAPEDAAVVWAWGVRSPSS